MYSNVSIYIQIDILGKVENNKIYIDSNKYLRSERVREKKKGKGKKSIFKAPQHTTPGNGNGVFVAVCNK